MCIRDRDMGFHGFFAMCLFYLRADAHSWLCLVSVLGSEDFFHLIIEIVFLADVHHAPDDLVMVDALHRIVCLLYTSPFTGLGAEPSGGGKGACQEVP